MLKWSSFVNAFNGLSFLIRKENNFRIHVICAVLVIASGFYYHISKWEWIVVTLCIALISSLEGINSSIEKLCDALHPDYSDKIKIVKDVAAAAVFIAAVGAAIIGVLIFVPKIFL